MISNGLRCWARLLVTVALQAVMPVGVADGGRLTLVIFNSAYAEGALANPVNDATDFAAKLRGLGFQAKLLLVSTKASTLLGRDGGVQCYSLENPKWGNGAFVMALVEVRPATPRMALSLSINRICTSRAS